MQRISCAAFVGCLILAVTVACAQAPEDSAQPMNQEQSQEVVATIGASSITMAELEEAVAGELLKIRQQEYQIKSNGLNKLIFDRLTEAAAAAEGISVEEYLKKNVEEAIGQPAEEEIQKVMNQYRARLAEDDEQARKQVVDYLSHQKRQDAQQALEKKLKDANKVVVLLEAPRAEVEIASHSPSRGPADAPVTMIEFTDFQCPYCSKVQGTIAEIMEHYEGNIRHVFMNLPLPMHSEAVMAAEAAMCANDQGKFWELHDWMFANQREINREKVLEQVRELGIDEAKFTACLDEHVWAEAVNGDKAKGASVGITGTPGFLINGRMIGGAHPFANFAEIIDDELLKAGIEPPKEKAQTSEGESNEAEEAKEAEAAG